MIVTPEAVAALLGKPEEPSAVAMAEQALPIAQAMVSAYTRGRGFNEAGEPNDEIGAVIMTVTARLMSNPGQLRTDETTGPFAHSVRDSFTGFSLAELFVLNRYRQRAH